jgi:phage baseplate assembly protein W
MEELLLYGLNSSTETYQVVPSVTCPPILMFIKGLDALYDKILNVLSQNKGTLFYNRDLGTEIDQAVFESDSETVKEQIRTQIAQDLTTNIHNLNISDIQIESQQTDRGIEYVISIVIKYQQHEYELKLKLDRSGVHNL